MAALAPRMASAASCGFSSFTSVPRAIASYKPLLDASGDKAIFDCRVCVPSRTLCSLPRSRELTDRASAAALTNAALYVPRESLPDAGEEEFYLADLIGLAALTEAGEAFGSVVDVLNFGGGDILEIARASGGETVLLPFKKEIFPQVDLKAGCVDLRAARRDRSRAFSSGGLNRHVAATVFTLFPEMFPGPLGVSLAGEALARGIWALETCRISARSGLGRHRAVDDTPAGGGPGMVIRADVLGASLDAGLAARRQAAAPAAQRRAARPSPKHAHGRSPRARASC